MLFFLFAGQISVLSHPPRLHPTKKKNPHACTRTPSSRTKNFQPAASHQVVYCSMTLHCTQASTHAHVLIHPPNPHTHTHRVCTCRIAAAQWWTAWVGPKKTLWNLPEGSSSQSGHVSISLLCHRLQTLSADFQMCLSLTATCLEVLLCGVLSPQF